jgi:hypothetical protein
MPDIVTVTYTPKPQIIEYVAAVVVRDPDGPDRETVDNDESE